MDAKGWYEEQEQELREQDKNARAAVEYAEQELRAAAIARPEEDVMAIAFRSIDQVVLYECEMSGQISDGYWENARPLSHYICMTSAVSYVAEDGEKLGCKNFYPERKYNFNNSELVEWLSDRMRFWVACVRVHPELILEMSSHWSWEDKYNNDFDVRVAQQQYTLKDLRSDLKDMSSIVNGKA